MDHLPKKIHQNGISYTLVGDYYIPDLKLLEESRPIGRWGRMHKAFLQEYRPGQYNELRDHLEETTAYYRKQLTDNGFDIIPGNHPCVPDRKSVV